MSDTPDRPHPLESPDPSDPLDPLKPTDVAHPFDPTSVFDDLPGGRKPAGGLDAFEGLTEHDEHPLAPELFEHHDHAQHAAPPAHPTAPVDRGDGPDLLHSDAPIDVSLFEDAPMDHHDEPIPAELFEDAHPAPPAARPIPPPPPPPPRHPEPAPRRVAGLAPAVGLLGLGELAIGAGLVYLLFLAPAAPAPPAGESRTADEPKKPGPDVLASLGTKVDTLAAELKAQAVRVDGLRARPEAASGPAVDLKPVEARLDDLARRVQALTPADSKSVEDAVARLTAAQAEATRTLDDLRKRVDDQSKRLADDQGRIAAIVENLAKAPEARPATGAQPAPGPAANRDEAEAAAFGAATALFRRNDFAGARAAFVRLQQSAPNDARVAYYAALANGFASGQWTGETETLVSKGVDLEKAGTPSRDKIDAAFSDLAPASAKAWLDAYRARAR